MPDSAAVPPATLNRLSIYLRCLRRLEQSGVQRVSSKQLAKQFRLSATQIRKDLTQFGEFGIRGVGYDVSQLSARLARLLSLDRPHRIVVVGMGNLGSALACHIGFNDGGYTVVAGFDNDHQKIGSTVGHLQVHDIAELAAVVADTGSEIGVLTVPAEAAQRNYTALADAGVRAVLNFAPVRLKLDPRVQTKNVDLRLNLEELGFFLGPRGVA